MPPLRTVGSPARVRTGINDLRQDFTLAAAVEKLEKELKELQEQKPISTARAGERETESSVKVALTGGPEIVIPREAQYMIFLTIVAQTRAEGLTTLEAEIWVNGVLTGAGDWAFIVGRNQFDGGIIVGFVNLALKTGDKVTVAVATSGKVKSNFNTAGLFAIPVT